MEPGACQPPVAAKMPASVQRMTIVRTKVAKSEPTFSTPILANIAVSAAKAADRTAQNCHERSADFMTLRTWEGVLSVLREAAQGAAGGSRSVGMPARNR